MLNRDCQNLLKSAVEKRISMGLTQTEVSRRSGLTQQQVSRLELAKSNPRLDTLLAYLKAIGIELNL